MTNQQVKLVIGFITYGKSTAKYLPYFLPSLSKSLKTLKNYEDTEIFVVDNSESKENENAGYIKGNYFGINIDWPGENLGFAKAHNKMLNKAKELGAEYYLAINIDMILEPDAIGKMIYAIDRGGELGSVCPKILRWDFPSPPAPLPLLLSRERGDRGKINIIDSCGIQLKSGLRFVDVGQSQVDLGQFDNVKILGPSGACAMYRMNALEKVKDGDQYFDELMFMYKEDCDLAYRLRLAGFKSKCVTNAIIYHDRTVKARGESNLKIALNRRSKRRQVKKWSFLNQQIIFVKYWHLQNFLDKLAIIWYELKILVFILLFEQYLLGQFFELWKMRKKINRKQKAESRKQF